MRTRGFGLSELVLSLFVSAALSMIILGALVFGAQRQRISQVERELVREASYAALTLDQLSKQGAVVAKLDDGSFTLLRMVAELGTAPEAASAEGVHYVAPQGAIRQVLCCDPMKGPGGVVAAHITKIEETAQGHWAVTMSRTVGKREVTVTAPQPGMP